MNPEAILALISDMYAQIHNLQNENSQLKSALSDREKVAASET